LNIMAVADSTVVAVAPVADAKPTKKQNKDLQKTRMCAYFLEGKCGYGTSCTFAHSLIEVKNVPNLAKTQLCAKFAEGKCTNVNCSYAHGEAELRDPPNFKKKICKWHSKGKCRNGASCGFVHEISELRTETDAPPGLELPGAKMPRVPTMKKTKVISAPPGLSLGDDNDCDASTEVPSSPESPSHVETDVSIASATSMPEEPLFRMMAGRGSAPLQQQVSSMSAAIAGLQAKLGNLEDMMLQQQVIQMQQQIQQLTEQCWAMESGVYGSQQVMPSAERTPLKSRLNAKATPWMPGMDRAVSEDSTSVGSD